MKLDVNWYENGLQSYGFYFYFTNFQPKRGIKK